MRFSIPHCFLVVFSSTRRICLVHHLHLRIAGEKTPKTCLDILPMRVLHVRHSILTCMFTYGSCQVQFKCFNPNKAALLCKNLCQRKHRTHRCKVLSFEKEKIVRVTTSRPNCLLFASCRMAIRIENARHAHIMNQTICKTMPETMHTSHVYLVLGTVRACNYFQL